MAASLAVAACAKPPAPSDAGASDAVAPREPLTIVGITSSRSGYPIDVRCGHDCSGTVTFEQGQAVLGVLGDAGCTVRVGDASVTLDDAPGRDDGGAPRRIPKTLSIDVTTEAARRGRLPDVLTRELTVEGSYVCPGEPSRALTLTFGAGAAVTAIWGQYQFAGNPTVPPFDAFREGKPKNAVTVLASDGVPSGATAEADLLRYIGPAADAADGVTLVGVVSELTPKPVVCTTDGGSFDVQPIGYGLAVYTYGANKLVGRTRIAAPAPDCARAAAEPVVHLASGRDVRIVRPAGAAIDAAMKRFIER